MGQTENLRLLYEVGTMRHMRRVWEQFHSPGTANVAEHVMRVAWIAQIIAIEEGADLAKVSQMALMHDLYQTRTGDAHWLNAQYGTRDKQQAVHDTVAGTSLESVVTNLWQELCEAKTLEAKVVHDADNLDVDIELSESKDKWAFVRRNQPVRQKVYEHRLKLETSKRIWEALQTADPHAWYVDEYLKIADRMS